MLCVVLGGCSVAFSGGQSSGSSVSAATTTAAAQAHARFGSARLSASFGTPTAPGTPGARVSVSNGAAGVLILGLVIADALHYLASTSMERGAASSEPIAHTCSCYGYEPAARTASAAASE